MNPPLGVPSLALLLRFITVLLGLLSVVRSFQVDCINVQGKTSITLSTSTGTITDGLAYDDAYTRFRSLLNMRPYDFGSLTRYGTKAAATMAAEASLSAVGAAAAATAATTTTTTQLSIPSSSLSEQVIHDANSIGDEEQEQRNDLRSEDPSSFRNHHMKIEDLVPANATILDEHELLPTSPPLSYDKFLTMQDKRVVVQIRYSAESGLRPFFLTAAKKLKASHPDVIVERRILPHVSDGGEGEALFEILVDGKVVVGKSRARRQKVARVDMARARSVFVSMQELDVAISRARRRRRPTTTYGTAADAINNQQGQRKRAWATNEL